MGNDHDPTVIRSLAVSGESVVDAFVYGRENPGTAVLRATPPFHGRMRARIHVCYATDPRDGSAVHLDPATLLEPSVVDDYPAQVHQTNDPPAQALDEWRRRAREAIVDTVTLGLTDESETEAGHEIDIVVLG